VLERLDSALARGAKIYAEIVGYGMNSDARDYVLPYYKRQAECMELAMNRAQVFGENSRTHINNTKSIIGHAMGAAGVLELAGNLPAFDDNLVHPSINCQNLDPECKLNNMVLDKAVQLESVDTILNNSFGMVGINSVIIVKKYQ
jgi:3-oxoacyl-[acyl-carrier-protein] synthase II